MSTFKNKTLLNADDNDVFDYNVFQKLMKDGESMSYFYKSFWNTVEILEDIIDLNEV